MLRYFRQLASESLVYGLSSVLSKMVYIVLVPLYTRLFTPEEYGALSLVVTVMGAVAVLVVLALDSAAHRWFWDTEEAADRKATVASWAWCQAALSLAAAGVLTVAAEPAGRALVGESGVAAYIRLSAWALPLTAFGMVATNWFRMQRRPWAALSFNLATVVVSLGLTVLLVVVLGMGVEGVFRAQLATAAWSAVVAAYVMGDWLHPRHFRRGRLGEMLRYAAPLVPAGVAFWVVNAVDRLFVQRYVSTAEVGVYQVGFAVASVVALGTQAFQQAWGPFSFSISRESDARQFYARALPVYLWVTCSASAAVAVLAPEILSVFATDAYAGGGTVAALLSFGYVMVGLTYIAGLGPGLARRTTPIGAAIIAAAAVNVALNFLLTPRMGKEGAALATLVSQALVPVYLFWRSQQVYPIPYRFPQAAAIVAFSGVVAWAGTSVRAEPAWLEIALKLLLVGLFVPALFVLGIVRPAAIAGAIRRAESRASF